MFGKPKKESKYRIKLVKSITLTAESNQKINLAVIISKRSRPLIISSLKANLNGLKIKRRKCDEKLS